MRFFALLALLVASSASAQPGAWLPLDDSGDAIAYTFHKISFDEDSFFGDTFSALSSAQFLQARVGVTPSVRIVADLPLAYASVESVFDGEDIGGLVVGNPQLGVEAALPADRGAASVGLGVRLPVVETLIEQDDDSGPATFYGNLATYDRLGAFLPETLTLYGTSTGRLDLSPEVALTGQIAPQALFALGDDDFRETEVLLSYLFRAEAQAGPALLTAGLRGTGILTEEVEDDRFLHALGLAAEVQAGPVRPGLFVELPLNGDNEEVLNAIYGFGLSYGLD